jgi:hypothetical protein
MKVFGNINMQQNLIQQAVLETEAEWPVSPVVGQIVFKNRVVYICAEINDNIPVWIPLTNEIGMHKYVQPVASSTWVINHNLNTPFVMVQVFDGNNQMVIPDEIIIDSSSQVTVSLGVAIIGSAVILTGSLDGQQKPTFSYEFNQTSPLSTWVVTHNLGYQPIVRVFSGAYEIQPASIFHNSANQVTISFLSPQIGTVRLI